MRFHSLPRTFAGLLIFSSLCAANASDLIGAEELLNQVRAVQQTDKSAASAPAADSIGKLAKDAAVYYDTMKSMDPKDAAATWMKLVTRWLKLTPSPQEMMMAAQMGEGRGEKLSLSDLFMHIPGPESWPELQRIADEPTTAIKPQQHAILLAITAKLNDDEAATSKALAMMEPSQKRNFHHRQEDELEKLLLPSANDHGSVIDRFRLALQERKGNSELILKVPDLLAHADKATVEPLLKQALMLSKVTLSFDGNSRTLEFTKQLALQNIDQMRKPRWELVLSPHSAELFEAMTKKFSPSNTKVDNTTTTDPAEALASIMGIETSTDIEMESGDDQDSVQINAQAYYYLDLLSSGALAQAKAVFKTDDNFLSNVGSALRSHPQDYPAGVIYAQLMEQVAEHKGNTELWEITQNLAKRLAKLPEHSEKLRAALENNEFDPKEKTGLSYHLATAYLNLNEPELAADYFDKAASGKVGSDSNYEPVESAKKLITLGRLLGKPEWSEQGITHLVRNYRESKNQTPQDFWSAQVRDANIVNSYLELEQPAEAEAFVLKSLLNSAKDDSVNARALRTSALQSLLKLYNHGKRYEDILVLLNEAPWWGVEDARAIDSQDATSIVGIAKAVELAGHKDKAELLLKNYIVAHPGRDATYDALTSMTGPALIPWLDELAGRDRFEERPLIWKAILLSQEGKLNEAEKAARLAMKVDPTDGEQPKGARLLAYSVLADILSHNGETSESQTLKKVVAAVRLAERGDELNELGLADQAVKLYQVASKDFSDAYCVEWRLARRLQEQGDEAGATAHYTKAFELMPNQFGRLANLCFGCEEVFGGLLSQTVAERVLQGQAAKPDAKATVFDLLGQLRESQGRYAEAASYFRKAIEKDPEYYDALQHLYDLSNRAYLSDQERASLATRLLELDPFMRHFQVDQKDAVSAKILYEAGERDRKWFKDQKTPIYPLAASAEQLQKDQSSKTKSSMFEMTWSITSGGRTTWSGPGEYLVRQEWLSHCIQMLNYANGMY